MMLYAINWTPLFAALTRRASVIREGMSCAGRTGRPSQAQITIATG